MVSEVGFLSISVDVIPILNATPGSAFVLTSAVEGRYLTKRRLISWKIAPALEVGIINFVALFLLKADSMTRLL